MFLFNFCSSLNNGKKQRVTLTHPDAMLCMQMPNARPFSQLWAPGPSLVEKSIVRLEG